MREPVVDPDTGCMRPSTLADLHDAAHPVDGLDHMRFFSQPLIARDVTDPRGTVRRMPHVLTIPGIGPTSALPDGGL